MSDILLQMIVSGVLLGSIYSMAGAGITVVSQISRLINFAHTDFIMIGMYVTFFMLTLFGIDPVFSIAIAAGVNFAFGVVIYNIIIRRMINYSRQMQMFATFGDKNAGNVGPK